MELPDLVDAPTFYLAAIKWRYFYQTRFISNSKIIVNISNVQKLNTCFNFFLNRIKPKALGFLKLSFFFFIRTFWTKILKPSLILQRSCLSLWSFLKICICAILKHVNWWCFLRTKISELLRHLRNLCFNLLVCTLVLNFLNCTVRFFLNIFRKKFENKSERYLNV